MNKQIIMASTGAILFITTVMIAIKTICKKRGKKG